MPTEEKHESSKKVLEKYKEYTSKKIIFFVSSMVILVALGVFSLTIGPADISIPKVISILIGRRATDSLYVVVWYIRLPRVLSAIVVGAGLSVAGAVMQSILRNPMGSPYTLGISHAAAFGVAFSIVVLGTGTTHSSLADAIVLNNPYIVTISAFVWSLISTFIILLMVRLKKATPATMILTGVALGSLFTAGYTAMQYFASQTELAAIVFWTFGNIGRVTWRDFGLMLAAVILSVSYFMFKSWEYEALDSGDESAKSLGVDVEQLRIHGMILSCFLTALIVSFAGIIGFVGLVVPHIVRKLIGGNERYLIPSSCILGAILLLASDTAARTIIAPVVLPVGILTSFIGAPLFIYLVIKKRDYW